MEQFQAIGTAALRTASNGQAFVREVEARTGIVVTLISGLEEAQLIHRGVMQALPPGREKKLIMDIGGGSVEFIIAGSKNVFWYDSFPIGVAILFNRFHKSDPIRKEEIIAVRRFLEEQLRPFLLVLEEYSIPDLIGASGAFDTIGEMAPRKKHGELSYRRVQSRLLYLIRLPDAYDHRRTAAAGKIARRKDRDDHRRHDPDRFCDPESKNQTNYYLSLRPEAGCFGGDAVRKSGNIFPEPGLTKLFVQNFISY